MRSASGFTLFELLVVMALIAILSAIAIPTVMSSTERNDVWTASERIGSQIRQARLKAISRNMSFRVRFDCPAAGQFRVLAVTGDPDIDNDDDRCNTTVDYDSGIYTMPNATSYDDDPPLLTVNSRGVYSSTKGIPTTITVTHVNGASRALAVSATGQINFEE